MILLHQTEPIMDLINFDLLFVLSMARQIVGMASHAAASQACEAYNFVLIGTKWALGQS